MYTHSFGSHRVLAFFLSTLFRFSQSGAVFRCRRLRNGSFSGHYCAASCNIGFSIFLFYLHAFSSSAPRPLFFFALFRTHPIREDKRPVSRQLPWEFIPSYALLLLTTRTHNSPFLFFSLHALHSYFFFRIPRRRIFSLSLSLWLANEYRTRERDGNKKKYKENRVKMKPVSREPLDSSTFFSSPSRSLVSISPLFFILPLILPAIPSLLRFVSRTLSMPHSDKLLCK